jgi:hypothetical protein
MDIIPRTQTDHTVQLARANYVGCIIRNFTFWVAKGLYKLAVDPAVTGEAVE